MSKIIREVPLKMQIFAAPFAFSCRKSDYCREGAAAGREEKAQPTWPGINAGRSQNSQTFPFFHQFKK